MINTNEIERLHSLLDRKEMLEKVLFHTITILA